MAERATAPHALVRMVRRGGLPAVRAAVWTLRAVWSVRRQLTRQDLASVRLPTPPPGAAAHRSVVLGVLRRTEASCLQRSLVLQRWYAGQRIRRTVVIGVTAPSAGFHAHAWLDGETDAEREEMVEILRHPTPEHWLARAGQGR
ncbi:lasso peptide biosynthesis B2 protein [Micromonospora sp. NPDC005203]|uniref:lasso peptide biosynthesis B2 protein n=1 Tax=Micromonospora sp. NPDC005203 TaxID=3364226 RepID=UPI003699BFAF